MLISDCSSDECSSDHTTIATDVGRIRRHIIPLLGTRRVRDITKPDMNNLMKDIIAGKTRVTMKTEKLRGKAIVRGGRGTASRTMGQIGRASCRGRGCQEE